MIAKIHSAYAHDFFNFVNQQNYKVLAGRVGDSQLSKIKCLEPDPGTPHQQLEKRKGFLTQFLLNAVLSGCTLDDLPAACTCDDIMAACVTGSFACAANATVNVEIEVLNDAPVTGVTVTSPTDSLFTGSFATAAVHDLGPTTGKMVVLEHDDAAFTWEPDAGGSTFYAHLKEVNGVAVLDAQPVPAYTVAGATGEQIVLILPDNPDINSVKIAVFSEDNA